MMQQQQQQQQQQQRMMMNNVPGGGMVNPNDPNGMIQPPPQQQPNPIFVFTTNLANEAASSVIKGQMRNIIEFHRHLPGTQEFLKNNGPHLMMQYPHPHPQAPGQMNKGPPGEFSVLFNRF